MSALSLPDSPRAILFHTDVPGGGARNQNILEAGWGGSLYRPSALNAGRPG